ncbi:PDC sensor domain-containing protein [Desulfovermiculus halophilus]|jgi:sigma-B regulation protein RsbU (phosphoserine phosphatase)|uniref:PDC sensor domain-containing protein n=1 Tax=Desulfovermiculus halophilus TaxID=339722 RepID=UPI0004825C16|nr:PDC sensor domain-containing protein [Desulfovermiculus halophilus]
MKFQTKLLLLLLTVALVPLCLSFAAQQISVNYFGDKIAEDARERMEESARSLLQTLTADYAHILHRDRSLAEMALHIQAQAVTSRLRADPPSSPPPVYYAEDYTSPQEQPGDLTTTDKYRQTDSRGKAHPIPVSFTQQTIYLAPGVDKEQVQDQVRRLSTMPDVYRTLHNIQPELFLWQYTALESGMHVSYPGKGAYPSSYDPRERLWYMLALDHGGQIEQIMTDVSTGSMILTMAMPIHSRDGSVAGVTALDIDYRQFFADWNIPDQWSQSMDCMVVAYRPGRRRAPNRQLEILLRNRKEDVNRDWRIPVEQKFLDLPAEHLNALLEDIRAGRSGIHRMPYQGQEALWAYGSRTDNEPSPWL